MNSLITNHRGLFLYFCPSLLFLVILFAQLTNASTSDIPNSVQRRTFSTGPKYFQDYTNPRTLQVTQVIFRHGARTPLSSYPTDPYKNFYYGVKGFGQLTLTGKRQALALGSYLRKRYLGFLNKAYELDEVFTQSSDVDRTIMTAETCLAGLFPPIRRMKIAKKLNWQPIPVHSIPKPIDNKILFKQFCQRYSDLSDRYLQTPALRKLSRKNQPIYKYATEKSGTEINDFDRLQWLVDTFIVEEENGLKLPSWTAKIYPVRTLPTLLLQFTAPSATPELKRLLISPLVTDILRNMELKITGSAQLPGTSSNDLSNYHNRSANMYLYSGHDTTVSGFLNSFQVYDGEPPSYTSAVIIELHQDPVSRKTEINGKIRNTYTIKVFYKKKTFEPIRELSLPDCPSPCSYTDFKSKYSQFILDDAQWNQECSLPVFIEK